MSQAVQSQVRSDADAPSAADKGQASHQQGYQQQQQHQQFDVGDEDEELDEESSYLQVAPRADSIALAQKRLAASGKNRDAAFSDELAGSARSGARPRSKLGPAGDRPSLLNSFGGCVPFSATPSCYVFSPAHITRLLSCSAPGACKI